MKIISLFLFIFLSGCMGVATTVTNTIDKMGMTPSYAKGMTSKEIQKRVGIPSFNVADDIPEGEFIKRDSQGKVEFKTVVRNKCFDQYMDLYYPNGQLRVHTPLVNCKAEGLSKAYTDTGLVKTEIWYKNGYADGEAKVYNPNGDIVETKVFKEGYVQ